MSNDNMLRIQKVSGKFCALFSVLVVVVPVLTLCFWLSFNQMPIGFIEDLPILVNQHLPLTARLTAFMVSLIPIAVVLYILVTLRELFTMYKNGIVFSEKNVSCFRRMGYLLICWVFANMIFYSLLSIILSFYDSEPGRILKIQFQTADIAMLIIGSVIVLVSWVMNEASKLEEEQAHTI